MKTLATTLVQCEAIIETNMRSFVEVGNALLAIRDNKLYTASYDTFEDYCRQRWGFGHNRAYQFIEASKVALECLPMVDIPNERVARELAAVPADDRPAVVEKIKNGKVTAAAVKEAVAELKPKVVQPADDWEQDSLGQVVPDELLEAWHGCDDLDRDAKLITTLKRDLLAKQGDAAYSHVPWQQVQEALASVSDWLRSARMYCVCPRWPKCRSGCGDCGDTGWLTKAEYEALPKAKR